jgi:hypothetical protein
MKGSDGVIVALATSELRPDKYAPMLDQAGKVFQIVN